MTPKRRKAVTVGSPLRSLFPDPVDAPFEDDPLDIGFAMCDRVVPGIRAGESYLLEFYLPVWERAAVARLKGVGGETIASEPHYLREFERWRAAWVEHIRPAKNFKHNAVFDAAVNVLLVADDLRTAIADGSAPELVAALAMQLVCEVLCGGSEIEADDLRSMAIAKSEHFKSTLGRRHQDYSRAEKACVQLAASLWKSNPLLRIGEVAKECHSRLQSALPDHLTALDKPPSTQTIKAWLKTAEQSGSLSIPKGASARGRPKSRD